MEPRGEAQIEHGPGRCLGHGQLGGHPLGNRQVPLAAELERLELDLDAIPELLPGAEPEPTEAEARHAAQRSAVRLL